MALSTGVQSEGELPNVGLGMTEESLSTLPTALLNERILAQTNALNKQLNIVPTVEQEAALYDVLLTREGLGLGATGGQGHVQRVGGESSPEIRALHIEELL